MAGLLDSDFVRWASDTSGYYRAKEKAQAAQQFQGLLGTLEQAGPPDPNQPQGGLLAPRAPDQQFWLKAAQIPGFDSLAGQQLGYEAAGQQAMGRQMQQQNWSTQNMTMAEVQQQALREQEALDRYNNMQAKLGLEGQRTAASVASGYASADSSRASADNSRIQADINRGNLALKNREVGLLSAPLYDQLKPNEQMAVNQANLRNDSAVESTREVLDYVLNRDPSAPLRGVGTAMGGAMATNWMLSALPVMKDMVGAGALDEGERKWMMELVNNPGDLHLTQTEENQIKLITQKVEDFRNQGYQAVQLKPPTTVGRGAVSRSVGAQPKGKLKPYTPPGGR